MKEIILCALALILLLAYARYRGWFFVDVKFHWKAEKSVQHEEQPKDWRQMEKSPANPDADQYNRLNSLASACEVHIDCISRMLVLAQWTVDNRAGRGISPQARICLAEANQALGTLRRLAEDVKEKLNTAQSETYSLRCQAFCSHLNNHVTKAIALHQKTYDELDACIAANSKGEKI